MSATVKEEEGDFTVTVTTPRALLLTRCEYRGSRDPLTSQLDHRRGRRQLAEAQSALERVEHVRPRRHHCPGAEVTSGGADRAQTPWIWVQTSKDGSDAPEGSAPSAAFLSEVAAIELSLTDDCQAIADNPGLPTQGKNSKAKARAAKHVEAVAALEATAKKVRASSG